MGKMSLIFVTKITILIQWRPLHHFQEKKPHKNINQTAYTCDTYDGKGTSNIDMLIAISLPWF